MRRIIHVGRLVKWKKVDLLIEAFKKLPIEAELIIVGDGKERKYLEKLAEGYNIKFTGAVINPKNFLESSDIFVLAGMGGLAINEAMKYGLPIVVSRADGTEKDLVIERYNGRYFKENDLDSLVDVLTEMLSDPFLKLMGENSYTLIVPVEQIINNYLNVFHYVLEDK